MAIEYGFTQQERNQYFNPEKVYSSRFNVECQHDFNPSFPISIWTYIPQSTLLEHLMKPSTL